MATCKTLNDKFERDLTAFSFSLYKAIDKNGNEFISPHSIASALLLLSLGTDSTTEKEIMTSIVADVLPNDVHRHYQILNNKLADSLGTGIDLCLANGVFGNKRFTILETYQSNAIHYYGSTVELFDFKAESEQSRTNINHWISTRTKDKVCDILAPGSIDKNTIMVLANAIYFKGTWERKFLSQNTTRTNFYVSPNVQRPVDMMYGCFDVASGQNTDMGCKVLQLSYSGNTMSMIFLLPNEKFGLSNLESRLNSTVFFQSLLPVLQKQQTIVKIPKFVTQSEYDLKPVLSKLGITEIFDRTAANFNKMVSLGSDQPPMYVSNACHKTYVEVNEEGSEAAAATIFAMAPGCAAPPQKPFEFIADHPFLFLILDHKTNMILFIGRFADP